jgi:outer membrane protein
MSSRFFCVPRLLGLVLTGLLCLPAPAQELRRITFDQAVQLALERNITVQRARNAMDLQETQIAAEKADFLPNLNASTGANRVYGLSFDQTTGRTFTEASDGFSTSLSSSYQLYTGSERRSSLEQARRTLDANTHTYERTRQTVVFNVIQQYLQLILNREQIRIREEDLAAQQQQLTRIEEFVRVGSRAVADLYQQQATVASSELQLLDAQRQAQLSETRLIQVLQLDPFGQYEFAAPETAAVPTPQNYAMETLLRTAFSQRSDLKAQVAGIEASTLGIRAARANFLPSVSLQGSLSTRYSSQQQRLAGLDANNQPLFERTPFFSQIGDNRSQFLGLNVSVPIFNNRRNTASVERARVQYENSRLELENLQQTIAVEVRQAYLDYQSYTQRLRVAEVQLQAAQQALDVAQERYNVGASTLVELSQARASYVRAASDRAQAISQLQFQQKLIEYYQGVIDPSKSLF